jgi:hypothetical protein
MVGTSIPSTVLPKAASLTEVFLAPSPPLVALSELHRLRHTFECELQLAAGPLDPKDRVRVDTYRLRNSMTGKNEADSPFRWTPWTARRPIGVESVRACLSNPRLTPVQATHEAIGNLVRRADDERRPDSLSGWLAGLAIGARSVVQAEAVVWATQLLTALDWTKLGRPAVGGDRSVVVGSSGQVLLRGRIEVRAQAVSGDDSFGPQPVLFSVVTGRPGPTARAELGLTALTVALDVRHDEIPLRVVGWWPQCGRALVVPVDIALLTRTCEAVVATVRATAPTRRGPRIAKLGTRESAERKTTRTAPRAAGKPPIIPAERVAS